MAHPHAPFKLMLASIKPLSAPRGMVSSRVALKPIETYLTWPSAAVVAWSIYFQLAFFTSCLSSVPISSFMSPMVMFQNSFS